MSPYQPIRRRKLTREELEARQQARMERIEETLDFPWRSLILGLAMAIAVVIILGGGIVSLIIAATIMAYFFRGMLIRQIKPPK